MSTQIDQPLESDVESRPLERARIAAELRELARPEPRAETPPAPARRGPRPIVWMALGLVAVVAVSFGGWNWWYARHHVTTDDAQVEGHIVPVLPKVSGYVADVRIEENQPVHKG